MPDPNQLVLGTEFEAEHGTRSISRHDLAPTAHSDNPYSISAVTLAHFKGFESYEVTLSPFNVLVGPNNCGKSTILRAIRLAFELTKMHFDRIRSGKATFLPGRSVPRSFLPVAQLRDLWTNGRMRAGNDWIPSQIALRLRSGHTLRFGIIGPWNAATSKINAPDLAAMSEIPAEIIEPFLARPPELVPASIGIVAEEEYRTPARRHVLVSSGRHNEIVRNYLHELSPENRDQSSTILDRYFGAHIQPVEFDETRDPFITVTYAKGTDYEHDLYSAGGGFLQVVEVLAFILRGDPGVVLLDEPDSHLHSSLQHALVDILEELAVSRRFQVLLATHSKDIINYVDPSRLVPMDLGREKAELMQAYASTVTVLKELGAIDNVDAYQIVKNRALVLVEGPTDREILPRLAAKVGSTLFAGTSRVSIVPIRGVDRFRTDPQLELIDELLGGPVKCVLVRDRDGLIDEWLGRLRAESRRPMHIWEYDCLESYLVCASALRRIIAEELGEQGAPTLANMQMVVETITAGLRDATVDRVAARLQEVEWQMNRQRVDAAAVNPQAREAVDSIWADPVARLRLVSGKEVLKRVRQRIQDDYKVSFGNMRILEAMVPGDVAPAVTDLLELARRALAGG